MMSFMLGYQTILYVKCARFTLKCNANEQNNRNSCVHEPSVHLYASSARQSTQR